MLAEGMPESIVDRMLDLERYFRENRAGTITDDVKRVLGREPKRFADYVRDTGVTGVWNADVASDGELKGLLDTVSICSGTAATGQEKPAVVYSGLQNRWRRLSHVFRFVAHPDREGPLLFSRRSRRTQVAIVSASLAALL
jgi:hypothetical protein